jgi:hypothetical protein
MKRIVAIGKCGHEMGVDDQWSAHCVRSNCAECCDCWKTCGFCGSEGDAYFFCNWCYGCELCCDCECCESCGEKLPECRCEDNK